MVVYFDFLTVTNSRWSFSVKEEDTRDIRFKSQGRNASYLNTHAKGMWRKVVFKIRGSINTWDQISKTVQSPWHFPPF